MNGLNPQPPEMAGYRRIEIDLRRQIGGGRWSVGAMLPSRRDLAREYSVSLVTLDRAIGPLLAEGLLRADDRRGTFVSRLGNDTAPPPLPSQSALPTNFRPASGDSESKMLSIGIVVTVERERSQEFMILHELEQYLSHQGITTHVVNRSGGGARLGLSDAISAAPKDTIQGLVIVCLDLDKQRIAQEISRVSLEGIPAVCILAGDLNLALPHVFYDNRSGGFQAAQHLLKRGWTDLTVVAPFTASWVTERIAGICDAAAYAQTPGSPVQTLSGEGKEWVIDSEPSDQGYAAVKSAIAAGWSLRGGVICVNDGVAFGVLKAAKELGLEAGKDFGLIGFDDEELSRSAGLTSMRPPMQGMAREAARLLMELDRGFDSSVQVRMRAHVIARASSRSRPAT